MAWWLTLLVACIGAAGGVAGGWLSGRIGSRATLQAVREERQARERRDYLEALGAFQQACSMAISFVTDVPPEDAPVPGDRFFVWSDKLLAWLTPKLLNEHTRAVFTKVLAISASINYKDRRFPWGYSFTFAQTPHWDASVAARVDVFLLTTNRVRALAPVEDVEVLRRVEQFVVDCIKLPPRQAKALSDWLPLRRELEQLATRAYERANSIRPIAAS